MIPLRQSKEVNAGSGIAAGGTSDVNKAKVSAGPEIVVPLVSCAAVPSDTNPEPPTAVGCEKLVGLYHANADPPRVTPTQ